MTALPKSGAELLDSLRPELLKAFRDVPSFGSISFEIHFNDGEPVRIVYGASLSRQVRKAGQI